MYKKKWYTCEVVVLLFIKPIVSLTSASLMMMMMMNFIPVSLYLADANWEHGHNLRGTNWILKSLVACVADVRKERGREFGRETAREEEGRRGTPAMPMFSPSRLLIIHTKITQLKHVWTSSCQINLSAMHVLFSYFSHCFSIVFPKQERKGKTRETRSSNEGRILLERLPS